MDAENQEAIIRRADAALYASKEAGRNCGHWHDGEKILPILEEEKKPAPTPTPVEPVLEDSTIEKLADDLPALLNRTAFCQHVRSRVAEWKRGGQTFALVLVEIDQFESLIHLYGPKFRDLLVASLARVVFAGVREMDLVARYSTSCLAFLLPKARLFDAIRVADRIREAAAQFAVSEGETKIGFTVSIGAIEVGSESDMIALFRKAEMALDAGHERGGNCLFCHDGNRCESATALAGIRS